MFYDVAVLLFFITFAGLPKHTFPFGKSLNTELLAPTTVPFPIVTFGATYTSVASQHSSLMCIGFAKIAKSLFK